MLPVGELQLSVILACVRAIGTWRY